jgi:hypothetical protein
VPSWLLKAAAQGTISLVPGRHRLNRLLQEHLTKSLALSEAGFEAKLAHCRHHLESFERVHGSGRRPRVSLELGTGWYPIVPVGLALAGIEQVITVDVSQLLDAARLERVLELYADSRLAAVLPGLDETRAKALIEAARAASPASPTEALAAIGVAAIVGDAQKLALPTTPVELIVSNNTLEHVPARTLAEILAAWRRVATPGAVLDHFIDLSDHYAHFDHSISEFNYLRFSPGSWRLFNNRLQYQNRLRASDYQRLFEQAGFRVVAHESELGSEAELAQIKLAAPFKRYQQADLAVLRSWLTAVAPS